MKTKLLLLMTAWLSLTLSLSADVVTGTDGENIAWSLDTSTGVLTISGTGKINGMPWGGYTSLIKKIIVEEGITDLNGRIYGLPYCEHLSLPASLVALHPHLTDGLTDDWDTSVFRNCPKLKLELAEGNECFALQGDCLYSADKTILFWGSKELESVIIPTSVTTIYASAFAGSNLKEVVLPANVRQTGSQAFAYCQKLVKATVKGSLNKVYPSLFISCRALEEVTFTKGSNSYHEFFAGCSNLRKAYLGGSSTISCNYAFEDCASLESVTLPASVKTMDSAFEGCTALRTVNLPSNVESWNSAFEGCKNLEIEHVVLKNTSSISRAFRNCKRIKSVDIMDLSTRWVNSAFDGCDSIIDVKVHLRNPMDITDLNLFSNAALQNATLHVPHGSLNAYAAANVWKDFAVKVQDQDADSLRYSGTLGGINWSILDNWTLKIEAADRTLSNAGEMTSYHENTYNEQNYSQYPWYQYRNQIVEVYVSKDVKSLGWGCFAKMDNLKKITLPFFGMYQTPKSENDVHPAENSFGAIFEQELIKSDLDFSSNNNTPIYSRYYSFNLGKNLEQIAYTGSTLKQSPFLGKVITENRYTGYYYDIWNAPSSEGVIISFDHIEISEPFAPQFANAIIDLDYKAESIPAGALANLSGLRSLKMKGTGAPNGATTFALNTLFGTSSVAGATLVDGYYMPSNLEEVVIKEGTTTIPNAAFKNLTMIKKITLPSTVTSVGDECFYGCSGLTDLYVNSAFPPVAYTNSFTGVSKYYCKLHVPVDSKDFYKGDDYWKYFYFIETDANVTITVKKNIDNAGAVTGITKYRNGEQAIFMAVPNGGYNFLMWLNERGDTLSMSNELVFKATCDSTIYAIFRPMLNTGGVTAATTANTVSLTWTQQAGATTYTVSIYSDAAMTNLVKTITIDANGNVLSIQKAGYAAPGEGNMSVTIEGLDGNSRYFYAVSAYNQKEVLISQQSGYFSTLEDTGIQYLSLPDSNASLSFSKNMITVSGADASIRVYSAYGQLVATHAKVDTVSFELPAGTYIVRSGSKTWKVLVK